MKTRRYKALLGILIAVILSSTALSGVVFATPQQAGTPLPPGGQGLMRGVNPETGKISFIGGGDPIRVPGISAAQGITPQDRAMGFAKTYGEEFGLSNPARELILLETRKDGNGNDVVHFQQTHLGVPVLAGEMLVNLHPGGDLLSISGEVSSSLQLDTQPTLTAQAAQGIALTEIARLHQTDPGQLTATPPELWIFDESLLTASSRPVELVWRLEVTAGDALQPVRELVLVNAQRGGISFHIDVLDSGIAADRKLNSLTTITRTLNSGAGSGVMLASRLIDPVDTHPSSTTMSPSSAGSRRTYTASGSETRPGTFLCDENQPACTAGADPDADNAHRYAADTFVFYNTHHGRNSFDNRGGTLVSTVHFGVGYQNAFWDGYQVVYGDGMAADDVVAHEITHGVTQYASNLIYAYQPGAINESLSDIWGEFVDQTNDSGTDDASVKWLIGEDAAQGALRSMSDPTRFGDPDRMGSSYYYNGPVDNGGVHFNSGVNNKAAFLMTEGGTFNGRTLTGIGMDKTAAVYYEAQTNLLTSGSNYNDLYYALVQACRNLLGGPSGLTPSDCSQVKTAAEAVEMIFLPPPAPTPTVTPPYSYQPLYLSLSSSQTIGGVSASDEDILRFDGTSWSLFFDGSDVGVGSPDLFAFSFLDADTLLMAFASEVTVNGITVAPQDILRFDAASLGSTTAGTFSLYFDGSDVGLDNSSGEKIDALSLLPDGRLLISTNGNPSVPGAVGKDEDLFAFLPSSLGDTTAGTWTLYFDGSDAGLSETSGEDVDALDIAGDRIYLSTQDDFSVAGMSGADEDIFLCQAVSLGEETACDYPAYLYFDGSTWGLEANDVDAFHLLTSAPAPTAVPSTTISAPPTGTPTGTATPTNIPATTATPTSTGGGTFTFAPAADAYVNAGSPTSNYGSATALRADASPDLHSYLRFDVQGLSGTVMKATLRVYANSSSSLGCMANAVSDNTWGEATLNYNSAPAVGNALGSSGLFGAGVWVEIDVTGYITGDGTYSLALTTASSTALSLASRESANPPQLIVETTP